MISCYRHTGFVVASINESLKFYVGVLNLELFSRAFEDNRTYIEKLVGIKDVKLEYAKLRLPGIGLLELLQYHYPSPTDNGGRPYPSNRHGCSHLALTVSNAGELHRLLETNGYHCNSAPLTSPDGKVKVFYAHDPDGIILEFVEELK